MIRTFLLLLVLGTSAAAEPQQPRYLSPDEMRIAGDRFLEKLFPPAELPTTTEGYWPLDPGIVEKYRREREASEERKKMPPQRGPLDRGRPLDMFPSLQR
jgi:hypothetical protein